MAFYRYAANYPDKDGEIVVRSMTPISPDNESASYYSHRLYTSEKDDAATYSVISIGHEKGWPTKVTGPRAPNRFIIHYVMEGSGFFNGEPVHKGQFFFTHPYEEHTITENPEEPMEFYYIGIAGPGTEDLMKRAGFFSIPKIRNFHFQDIIAPTFYDALYKTHPEADTEFYLLSVFMKLLGLHCQENHQSDPEHHKMDSFLYYKNALIFIENYLLEGVTPKDVADHLHISPSYLRVIFSKFCKYSLRELLIRKRIDCAANRLIFDDDSVVQAAALVGYSDYTLFSKIFKKYTGVSPLTYKKQHCKIDVLPENINLPLAGEQEEAT